MRCLRIKFPISELSLLEEAVQRFNDYSAYLDDIKIKHHKEYQVLQIPVAESALFIESFIDHFPRFSKERLRKDLIKATEAYLVEEPGNLPASKSLEILKSLVF